MRTLFTFIILTALTFISTPAFSNNDFWQTYSDQLIINHHKKTNSPFNYNHQTSSKENLSLITKSFSQSFGKRLFNSPNYLSAIPCMFSKEPEKCVLEAQINPIFNEIKFINAPEISQSTINRIKKIIPSSVLITRNKPISKKKRSYKISHHDISTPKLGFDSNNLDVFTSTSFYTYYDIYIEPQYAVRNKFSVTAIKDNWFLEIKDTQTTLKYGFDDHYKLAITKDSIYLESVIVFR